MSTKIKTITLSAGWRYQGIPGVLDDPIGTNNGYRVEKITDSVEFKPLDMLHKSTVAELCEAKEWKVIIIAIPG